MTNTQSTEQPIESFAEFRERITADFEKAAAENGLTPREFLTQIVTRIVFVRLMWRAAKRGDTAKTVAWGATLLRDQIVGTNRKNRAHLDRLNQGKSTIGSVHVHGTPTSPADVVEGIKGMKGDQRQ